MPLITKLRYALSIVAIITMAGCTQTQVPDPEVKNTGVKGTGVKATEIKSPEVKGPELTGPTLVQVLKDSVDGVDGLDNPRSVSITPDGTLLFLTSGDDNAVAIFDISDNFQLSFRQVFRNDDPNVQGLEGASSVTFLPKANKALVASFYDSALTVFGENRDGHYVLQKHISDNLSVQQIFQDNQPLDHLDTLGLLGAWGIASSGDGRHVYIASYKSNALSVFEMDPQGNPVFNRVEKGNVLSDLGGLGSPVSVALSPDNHQLVVAGFEQHRITIFNRDDSGQLTLKQVLENQQQGIRHLVNPQRIIASADNRYLYVASAGSSAIVVFGQDANGEYRFLQSITNEDIGGAGLSGVGTLAISPDGKKLLAAGEADSGIVSFIRQPNGLLKFKSLLTQEQFSTGSTDQHLLDTVTSLTFSHDGHYLVITSATNDSVAILKLYN